MLGRIFKDRLTRTHNLRDLSTQSDRGLENNGTDDRSEKHRGLGRSLTAEKGVLATIDENRRLSCRVLLLLEITNESSRGREVDRSRSERNQDRVGPTNHSTRELVSSIFAVNDARRTIHQGDVVFIGRQSGQAAFELTSWNHIEREAILTPRKTPQSGRGLGISIDYPDTIFRPSKRSR